MSGFVRCLQPSPLLRRQYLAALKEPQEWFLEELVSIGEIWQRDDGSYAVTHGRTLVEFFSANPANSKSALRDFHNQNGFLTALVKSFDLNSVRSCRQLGWTETVGGFLFRDRKSRGHVAFDRVVMHPSTSTDAHAIWEINDSFFGSKDEVEILAGSNKLWTIKVDGKISGCGVSNRISKDSDAMDIGRIKHPSKRTGNTHRKCAFRPS